jgi:hypothetical protein
VHKGRVDPGAANGERRLGRVPAVSVRRRGRQPLHAQVVPRQGRVLQIRSQGAAPHPGVLAARIQSRRESKAIFFTLSRLLRMLLFAWFPFSRRAPPLSF